MKESERTRRNFVSFVGLLFFLTHTLGVRMEKYLSVRRAQSKIASEATSDEKWDAPVTLADTVRADMSEIVGILLENSPCRCDAIDPPSTNMQDYQTVIIVDASASGWGAFVKIHETVYEIRRGWTTTLRYSAHAEPTAAKEALRWARAQGATGRTAVITDHIALPLGQRKFWNRFGGFSNAWPVNDFFAELYDMDGDAQVFYVEGAKNVADGPSRGNTLGQQILVKKLQSFAFPDLATFNHPYAQRPPLRPMR